MIPWNINLKFVKTFTCIVGFSMVAGIVHTSSFVGLCRKIAKDAKRHVQAAAIKLLPLAYPLVTTLAVIWWRSRVHFSNHLLKFQYAVQLQQHFTSAVIKKHPLNKEIISNPIPTTFTALV